MEAYSKKDDPNLAEKLKTFPQFSDMLKQYPKQENEQLIEIVFSDNLFDLTNVINRYHYGYLVPLLKNNEEFKQNLVTARSIHGKINLTIRHIRVKMFEKNNQYLHLVWENIEEKVVSPENYNTKYLEKI